MCDGAHASKIRISVSSVNGSPAAKSHVDSLKHPLQQWVHPETKRDTRTPGPSAMSHVLIAE